MHEGVDTLRLIDVEVPELVHCQGTYPGNGARMLAYHGPVRSVGGRVFFVTAVQGGKADRVAHKEDRLSQVRIFRLGGNQRHVPHGFQQCHGCPLP